MHNYLRGHIVPPPITWGYTKEPIVGRHKLAFIGIIRDFVIFWIIITPFDTFSVRILKVLRERSRCFWNFNKVLLFRWKIQFWPLLIGWRLIRATPPVARFFREKYRHFICIWFLDLVTKILFANFWKKNYGSSGTRELSHDLFSTGGKCNFRGF